MIIPKTLKTLEFDKILEMLVPYAQSEAGKIIALNLVPYTSIERARAELELTIQADRVLYVHSVNPNYAFDDVTECLSKAEKMSILSMGEVLKVGRLLKSSRITSTAINDINDNKVEMMQMMAKNIFVSFTIEKAIDKSIISDNEMSDNASHELRAIRTKIARCNSKIRDKLNSYITSSATVKYLQDNIVTLRNNRYVIPVKTEHKGQISGLIHDQSSSGSTVFVEPMMVVELNNELRLLVSDEEKEIYNILKDFTERIRTVVDNLQVNQEILSELDVIFAKAKLARTMKAIPPVITENGKIEIIEGRHPLIDPASVVPVTVILGGEYRILMITGPNTGGKTVTLKLTGLLTIMALTGMFIPAEANSKVTMFDSIYCDIGDEQSIEQSLSTFSSHMTNLIYITNNADDKSLILLDEIGAGTDPQEGAALAMAITTHILKSRAHGVITTHYPELKEYSLGTDMIENASMDFAPDTFRPTYKLVIGVPGASNAIHIAECLGLNKSIVEQAREKLSKEKVKFEQVLTLAEEARRKADDARLDIEGKRDDIELERRQIKLERAKLAREREIIQTNATKEKDKLIGIALREVNEIVDEIKNMLDDTDSIDIFKAHKLRKRLKDISETKDVEVEEVTEIEEDKTPITIGDKVYIKNLKQEAIIAGINNNKKEYSINIGSISTQVKYKDVVKLYKKDKNSQKTKVNISHLHTASPLVLELNLVGQNADEAMYNLDIYINDASYSGLEEARIVHGKGTGILRNAVHSYLKSSGLVSTYRLGKYGEGQGGVTIVYFK